MAKVAKAKKPAKAAKPSKADKDKLIDEKLGELDDAMADLKVATDEYEHKHAEAAAAKKRVALVQADVNQINTDLCDIRKGRYNLRLPFPDEKAKGKKAAPGEVIDSGAMQWSEGGREVIMPTIRLPSWSNAQAGRRVSTVQFSQFQGVSGG